MDDGEQRLLSFWRTARRLAVAIVLGGAAVLYVAAPEGRPVALGWVLGGAVSILRYTAYFRALGRIAASPGAVVRARLIMYAMSGAALAVAFAFAETFSLFGTAAGLLAMNAAVFVAGLLTGRRELEQCPGTADGPQ
jgi:hypothetical protein